MTASQTQVAQVAQVAPISGIVAAQPMVSGFSVTPIGEAVQTMYAKLGTVSVNVVASLMVDNSLWIEDFGLSVHQHAVGTDADGQTLKYWQNAVSTARGIQRKALMKFDLVLPSVAQLESWIAAEAKAAGYCLSIEDLANWGNGRKSISAKRSEAAEAKAEAAKLDAALNAKRLQVKFDADKAAEEVKAAEAEAAKAKAAEAEAVKLDPVIAAQLRTEEEQSAKLAQSIDKAAKAAEADKAEAAKAEAEAAKASEVETIDKEAAPAPLVLFTVTDTGTGYSFALDEAATLEDLKAIRAQVAKYIKARTTVTA